MRFNDENSVAATPEVYFNRMFRETYPNIVAYLEKISNNKELAQDIAQEAYLKVWQKLSLLPEDEEEATRYILIIARNCFLDHIKQSLRQKKQLESWASLHLVTDSAPVAMEYKEQQRIVDHTINSHEEAVRRYYLLNREEGLTYKEIAAMEGVSEKTVERYIGRMLRSLRSRLASFLF